MGVPGTRGGGYWFTLGNKKLGVFHTRKVSKYFKNNENFLKILKTKD